MKRDCTHQWRKGVALLCAVCFLPWEALPAAAAPVFPEVRETHWIQNGGVLAPSADTAAQTETDSSEDTVSIQKAASLPESYSLLDVDGKCYVTSVKDQGSTGLCWAYSSLGACESNILMQGLELPEAWLDSKGELNFSEAALGWYPFTNHLLPGDPTSGDYISLEKKGLSGGNPTIASFVLAAGIGTQLEEYAALSDWNKGYSEYQRYNSYYRMKSSDVIVRPGENTVSTVKQWMMESGAVAASFYSKGTFYDNGSSTAYYQNKYDIDRADHAILIVGWDDSYSRENFKPGMQPDADGAWLVQNSWGRDSGDDGYFWLSYEEPSLCELARFQMEDAVSHSAYYQYDGSVSYASVNFPAAANVFTAETDGTLSEVMFAAASSNPQTCWYTISVYRMAEGSNDPTDGEKLCTKQGTARFGGYKNISLADRTVALKKGDRFSVILELRRTRSSQEPLYLSFESNASDTLERHCTILPGQTYISDGESWMDMTEVQQWQNNSGKYPYAELGNAAIKAIIRPDSAAADRTMLDNALAYGAPTSGENALYQEAYQEAIRLDENASQAEVDNAAGNLLAGLERAGIFRYSEHIYDKETAAAAFLLGDVNQDGTITAADVSCAMTAQARDGAGLSTSLQMAQAAAADIDGNGVLSAADCAYLLQYCAFEGAGISKNWDEILP